MKKFFMRPELRALRLFFMLIILLSCEKNIYVYAAQNIKIEIPELIYINKNNFTLGDIAKISGGSRSNRKALAEINFNLNKNILTRREVLNAINLSGADDVQIQLYMPLNVKFEYPDYEGNFTETADINVNENYNLNNGDQNKLKELENTLKNLASWNGNIEISINGNNNKIPAGKLIDPSSLIPGTPAVTLRFKDNSGRIKNLPVKLTWSQNVVFATRNIKRGEKFLTGNLTVRPMIINRPGVYAVNLNEVRGNISNRNIKQGEAIMLNSFTSANIIKKGQRVKIVARFKGAKAELDGILMEDGTPGDFVKVRRSDNKQAVLQARIINSNLVEVEIR